jgi:hypothetical protein
MVVVPEVEPPVTRPVLLMVATVVALLLHVPPAAASLRLVVPFWHNTLLPSIALIAFTLTTVVAVQPVAEV